MYAGAIEVLPGSPESIVITALQWSTTWPQAVMVLDRGIKRLTHLPASHQERYLVVADASTAYGSDGSWRLSKRGNDGLAFIRQGQLTPSTMCVVLDPGLGYGA